LTAEPVAPSVTLTAEPDDEWLSLHTRKVPVDLLTAVVDGEVVFGRVADAGVGRVAVTVAPDGTRWGGLSSVHVVEDARRRGVARSLCDALLAWAVERGATRAYVQVLSDNVAATKLYESMGFGEHHRSRYVSLR
jgi:ribosomal protein S18 acetylase RimI-like enzyme